MDDDVYGPIEGLACPECGSDVYSYPDCPGYMQSGRVYTCHPCGNGDTYTCGASCGWQYQEETIRRGVDGQPLRSGFSTKEPVEVGGS